MKPELWRMVFGFLVLGIMAGLAVSIALGHVEEQSSYGLMPLLVALTSLATQFAQWAFGGKSDKPEDPSAKP